MSSSFTVLWNADRVRIARSLEGKLVPFLCGGPHVSQPSFSRAGVKPGDCVYPIYVHKKVLHIMARFVVGSFTTPEALIADRKDLFPKGTRSDWTFESHDGPAESAPWLRALLPQESSLLTLTPRLSMAALERLTYVSKKSSRGVRGIKDGELTSIVSLQGVYRLSTDSAEDFAHVVDHPI
jgi:hypothetical protein